MYGNSLFAFLCTLCSFSMIVGYILSFCPQNDCRIYSVCPHICLQWLKTLLLHFIAAKLSWLNLLTSLCYLHERFWLDTTSTKNWLEKHYSDFAFNQKSTDHPFTIYDRWTTIYEQQENPQAWKAYKQF